jgi:hypothetical protein
LIAIGVLLAGLVLATSAFWLSRRSHSLSPSHFAEVDVAQVPDRQP